MAINLKGFPAHNPYEDSWQFCNRCQRFYKRQEARCPYHFTPLRTMKLQSRTSRRGRAGSMRRVWNNGLGLPPWTLLPEFKDTIEGQESIKRFKDAQASIRSEIERAPYDLEITFGSLGAAEFKHHWFIKKRNVEN